MAASAGPQHDVERWVKKSLEDKHLENIKVNKSTGLSGDGYMGDIIFAEVTGDSKSGNEETFHLVLKFSQKNEHLRSTLPVAEVYRQEIHMYNVVFPLCQDFRKKKGLKELRFVPKCYEAFAGCGSEVLVLDNLKALGYRLHDKYKPMDMEHVRIVLEAYGQWHAFSFALQEQNKEEYRRISAPLTDILTTMLNSDDAAVSFTSGVSRARESLRGNNEHDLLEKFNGLLVRGEVKTFLEVTNEVPDKTIITHGDCWNNNFMFKYEKNNSSPEEVAVLDWQVSFRRSPACDLSHFLYCVASKNELDQLDKLLDIYYESLSDSIRQLGSDPDKLFTKGELKEHWRNYSLYGFLVGVMVLPLAMCESDDAPAFEKMDAEENLEKMMNNLEIKQKGAYDKRIRDIVERYTSSPYTI